VEAECLHLSRRKIVSGKYAFQLPTFSTVEL
jgi:hypothetical protein